MQIDLSLLKKHFSSNETVQTVLPLYAAERMIKKENSKNGFVVVSENEVVFLGDCFKEEYGKIKKTKEKITEKLININGMEILNLPILRYKILRYVYLTFVVVWTLGFASEPATLLEGGAVGLAMLIALYIYFLYKGIQYYKICQVFYIAFKFNAKTVYVPLYKVDEKELDYFGEKILSLCKQKNEILS